LHVEPVNHVLQSGVSGEEEVEDRRQEKKEEEEVEWVDKVRFGLWKYRG